MEVPNFYYSNLCHLCKKIHENLKRCASCKTVAYCSREHQITDWPNHMEVCRVISKLRPITNFRNIKCSHDFKKIQIKQSIIWQTELKRTLKSHESQMWMFPKVCAVCYSNTNIINCDRCFNQFYCCEEHKKRHFNIHDKFCSALKTAMLVDIHFFSGEKQDRIILKEIENYYVLTEDKTDFLNTVCHRNITWRDDVQYIIDTDQLLSGATILLGLEKSGMLSERNLEKNYLEIHFVGASNFELCLNWFCILELLFHYVRNIREICVVLIGPELNEDENVDFMQFKEALCEKCQHKVDKMVFKTSRDLYHEKLESLGKPDFVVAFNSGLHEFKGDTTNDFWEKSIQSLVKCSGVPLLLTAYTEDEINRDLNRLKEVENVENFYGPKENPFKNQRPFRNWTSFDVPVFYNNAFMAVVARNEDDGD